MHIKYATVIKYLLALKSFILKVATQTIKKSFCTTIINLGIIVFLTFEYILIQTGNNVHACIDEIFLFPSTLAAHCGSRAHDFIQLRMQFLKSMISTN